VWPCLAKRGNNPGWVSCPRSSTFGQNHARTYLNLGMNISCHDLGNFLFLDDPPSWIIMTDDWIIMDDLCRQDAKPGKLYKSLIAELTLQMWKTTSIKLNDISLWSQSRVTTYTDLNNHHLLKCLNEYSIFLIDS